MGDSIAVDTLSGVVEFIGLKTTRVRSDSGEQLIFSNSDLTKSRVKNFKRMQTRCITFKIGIAQQTPLDKVKLIPQMVEKIFSSMKDVKLDRAHLVSFGDFALNYEVVYFVLSADYKLYMDKQQEINFALKEFFEKEKIRLASSIPTPFPTSELRSA